MASSILNSDDGVISGTSGLKSTGGDDGVLVFQSKGTETARINTDKQIVAAAGTASLPIYSTTGDLNTGIFFPAADTIAFAEGGAEAMRIDSSGNVGIGTTSPTFKVQAEGATPAYFGLNSEEGTRFGYASALPTNSLNCFVGWIPDSVGSGGINGDLALCPRTSAGANIRFFTGTTSATERARITSGGYFKASNDGTYFGSTSSYHELNQSTANQVSVFRNSNASNPFGLYVTFTGATPNNTTNYFLACEDATNDKCIIYSSGTVTNRTGTYNAFSDIKLKQDIVDASSQWDDIKALRVVKYRLKDEVAADPNYPAYIGLLAQEVEQVSSGLVEDYPDFETVTHTREVEKTREVEVTPAVLDEDGNVVEPAVMETETYTKEEEYTERVATGTVTKGVKYSILYMKAVKALQEAMERIETLEAKVSALEGN
jgi:hypothetical protein